MEPLRPAHRPALFHKGYRLRGKFGQSAFAVLGPYDGGSATVGNGNMVGFEVDSPEALASFHAHAIELGATDEGALGKRGSDASPFHFGYFRDPDGNKLCGYYVEGKPAG
jgi:catechol 2,3-dioxygenase-like lactoylglutathione lyase family enzyme